MNAVLPFILKLGRFSPLLLALSTGACSTNEIRTPQNRFESPEITGKKFSSAVGFYTSGHISFSPNSTNPSNPAIIDDSPSFPEMSDNPDVWSGFTWVGRMLEFMLSSIGLEARGDINDHLEIYFNTRYEMAAIRAKYQFLGLPAADAKAGNFSMALDLGYGKIGIGISQPSALNTPYDVVDAALITGYRTSDKIMLYGGPYFSQFLSSSTEPEMVDAIQRGANLGLRFQLGERTTLSLEMARSQFDAAATHYLKTHYGLQLIFHIR